MELLELYKEENKNILYSMSWLNKNSIFDKSTGSFEEIDLFTFLEKINEFDYEKDILYDDIYYILEYTEDTILYLIKNINREIKREHRVMPISQAKEFDQTSILWLSRKNGRTLKEKLSGGKIKVVKRYSNIDTYENRIFKILLKKLVLVYEERDDLEEFDTLFIKIRKWLKSEEAKSIDEYRKIVYNNILLHHKNYSKIFKSYKWFNSLNEKVKVYKELYPRQILSIVTFDILSKLQFKTEKLILASDLKIDYSNFEIPFTEKWLPENIDLEYNIKNMKIKTIDEVCFENIKNLVNNVFKSQLNIKLNQDRTFIIQEQNEVFIDFFRLFPITKIEEKIIEFPVTMKQKIDNSIVNANNTKIIDLNHEFYTLPGVLKTFDTSILKYFLDDFTHYFKDTQLNYIIPDYVNIFEFSQVKRLISSYFKNSKSIPKSILAGFSYIERNEVKVNDTLLYLQKNYDDELFVTPLLIKSNPKLKDISSGLYIERHPTRRIEGSNQELLNSLSKIFSKKISEKLISKFLRNGIKGIKNEEIVFYQDEKIIDLNRFYLPNNRYDNIVDLKKIYNTKKSLFRTKHKFITDERNENLKNFEKISHYEKQGFTLWREHLPDLSMEIVKNGYFDKFVLVDENSRIEHKTIEIKEQFLIPANIKKLSFPLYLDNQNIGFKAEVISKQFPFKNDVECKLQLTYDYERETPYELIFKPLDKELKDIKVKWIKEDYTNIELPVPSYPPKKSWDDFRYDPIEREGYHDLLEWILDRLEILNDINVAPYTFINKEIRLIKKENQNKVKGCFLWGKLDKNNKYFCFVNVNGEKIFCHSSNFKENINIDDFYEDMPVYLNVKENKDGLSGKNITFSYLSEEEIIERVKKEYKNKTLNEKLQFAIKALRSIQYPLKTVWNNHSLSDYDVPNTFRNKIFNYIQLSLKYIQESNNIEFNKELFYFLSSLHQDMPIQISNILVNYSKVMKEPMSLATALGNCQLEWQQKIFNNIMKKLDDREEDNFLLQILTISLWRSETLISYFEKRDIEMIVKNLTIEMKKNILQLNNKSNAIVRNFELLLALLRFRKISNILIPIDKNTLVLINILDKTTLYFIENNIRFKSRIQLNIDKPKAFSETPDLFYALRVYLSGDNGAANSIQIIGVSDD